MNNFNYKEYEILAKEESAPDIFTFKITSKLQFKPGQFIQASLPHIGESTFAPCSDPTQKDFFELCIRGCGSTTSMMTKLLPGDTLKIRGPYGNGWPLKNLKSKDIIMIAGGMGLIPLRPLILQIMKNRDDYGKIQLIGGFRTIDHILFKDDLEKWSKKISIDFYIENMGSNSKYKKGLVTEPLQNNKFNIKKSIVLICGPEIMVPFCNDTLLSRGFKENQIYISYERRMECGIGVCQHCNIGRYLTCQDGPIFRYDQIKTEIGK
jgi:sulfhydrogenase subunit gamma (sulfur reductase)